MNYKQMASHKVFEGGAWKLPPKPWSWATSNHMNKIKWANHKNLNGSMIEIKSTKSNEDKRIRTYPSWIAQVHPLHLLFKQNIDAYTKR